MGPEKLLLSEGVLVFLTVWCWFRSSSAGDPSAQECLQLVVRATQVFREEYIQKFEQAREEIARRYYHPCSIYLVLTRCVIQGAFRKFVD